MLIAVTTNPVVALLGSPATLTVVTLITALTAGYLYWKQRRDRQKDAAGIILREIKGAEDMLPTVKRLIQEARAMNVPDKVQVMKSDSWPELQHVLARRLPQDVMRTIGEFYANCRLLDEALAVIDDAFYRNAQEARINQARVVADMLAERVKATLPNPEDDKATVAKNEERLQEYSRRSADFQANWPAPKMSYVPVRAANDAEKYLELLPRNLSQTRVGDKLRRASTGLAARLFNRKDL